MSGLFLFRCFVFQRPPGSTSLNAPSRQFLSPGEGGRRQQAGGALSVLLTDGVVVEVELHHHWVGQAGVLLLQFIQFRDVAQSLQNLDQMLPFYFSGSLHLIYRGKSLNLSILFESPPRPPFLDSSEFFRCQKKPLESKKK